MLPASKVSPPITLLQEICSRNGLTPDYQLLSTEGSVHEPTFKIAVTVTDISAIASGQSKKKARHAAAREAIERLRQKKDLNFDGINFETLAPVDDDATSQSAYATAINEANPVGKLQEICMKMRVNPPDYETRDERGLAHERVFYLSCNIASLNLSTMGQGRSKKLAKRQAAEHMLTKLESSGIYDKSATERKGKTETGVDSLYIDADDNSHFVRARRLVTEFIVALDCTESELRKDIKLIEENDVDNDFFYDLLNDTMPEDYFYEFAYLNDSTCLLHIYEKATLTNPPTLVMTSFGVGNSVTAMKNAVINAYKLILAMKNPLIRKDCHQEEEENLQSHPSPEAMES